MNINYLPEDCLYIILCYCAEYIPAVRATCDMWWHICGRITNPPVLKLTDLAHRGHSNLLLWSITGESISEKKLNEMLVSATHAERLDTMDLLKNWGANSFNEALFWASNLGRIKAMKLLRNWGAKDFDEALIWASKLGRVKAMNLLRKWGAKDFDEALIWASRNGWLKAMRRLRKWGAKDYNLALAGAACNYEVKAMSLLRKWEASYFSATKYCCALGLFNISIWKNEFCLTDSDTYSESSEYEDSTDFAQE